MTKEGVYEPGDKLIIGNTKLVATTASTDNSCCYVCDNGTNKCWFLNKNIPCPKCHSSKFGFIDYVGIRVIFLPT